MKKHFVPWSVENYAKHKKNPLLNKLNHVFFRALVPYKREIAAKMKIMNFIWRRWFWDFLAARRSLEKTTRHCMTSKYKDNKTGFHNYKDINDSNLLDLLAFSCSNLSKITFFDDFCNIFCAPKTTFNGRDKYIKLNFKGSHIQLTLNVLNGEKYVFNSPLIHSEKRRQIERKDELEKMIY